MTRTQILENAPIDMQEELDYEPLRFNGAIPLDLIAANGPLAGTLRGDNRKEFLLYELLNRPHGPVVGPHVDLKELLPDEGRLVGLVRGFNVSEIDVMAAPRSLWCKEGH